jgi:hypothetical protein
MGDGTVRFSEVPDSAIHLDIGCRDASGRRIGRVNFKDRTYRVEGSTEDLPFPELCWTRQQAEKWPIFDQGDAP